LLFVLADSAFLSEQASSRTLFDNLSEQESVRSANFPPHAQERTQSKEARPFVEEARKLRKKKRGEDNCETWSTSKVIPSKPLQMVLKAGDPFECRQSSI
jgi:hypothetical protein